MNDLRIRGVHEWIINVSCFKEQFILGKSTDGKNCCSINFFELRLNR